VNVVTLCEILLNGKTAAHIVLADTHNKFPAILSILARDADEIWHLGDVCAERILDELRAPSRPVKVVRGNCDSNFEWPWLSILFGAD